jgi:hypothetical protein
MQGTRKELTLMQLLIHLSMSVFAWDEQKASLEQRCVIQIQVGAYFHRFDLDTFITT